MAHLLMIESWVRAAGLILPQKIRALGHRYTFVTRKPEHYGNWARGAGLLPGGEFADEHPVVALADEVVTVDTNDVDVLIGAAQRIDRARPVDGVLSCCDYYLEAVAHVARSLGLAGPPPSAVRVAQKKHLMREACRRAGLPGPAFLASGDVDEALRFADTVGYPVVAKAVDLSASEHIYAAYRPEELSEAFARIHAARHNVRGQERPAEVLVEEYLRGEEFSVETVTFRGATTVVGVTDKSLAGPSSFVETTLMHPADVPDSVRDAMADFVRQALVAVGYTHGLAHTEVKLTDRGPRLVEINARMGGSFLFEAVELVTGVDFFECLVDLALDQPPTLDGRERRFRSAALRFLLPPAAGTIVGVDGADAVRADSNVYRLVVDDVVGKNVRGPIDNNDFIGYVLTTDRAGLGARRKAEWAADVIRVRLA